MRTDRPFHTERGTVTLEFLRQLARLSWSEDGPRLAKEFLCKHTVVRSSPFLTFRKRTSTEPPSNWGDGTPAIGLTLRHDRIDNFWFCLMHELAHVGRHMDIDGDAAFVDDLTLRDIEGAREDPKEVQADEWAEEALIPRAIWETSAARQQPTAMSVINLANALQVHPAIVAGKIRHEQRNFRLLSQLVKFGVTLAWRHRSLERNERRRNGRPRNGERRMELSVHESTPSLTTASGYPKAPAGVSRPS